MKTILKKLRTKLNKIFTLRKHMLTLLATCISESCIKIKIKKAFKAPQRSVKIKI